MAYIRSRPTRTKKKWNADHVWAVDNPCFKTAMKDTEENWLRRLKETPSDLALRIEYAAWLDQHAEPNKALRLRIAVERKKGTQLFVLTFSSLVFTLLPD